MKKIFLSLFLSISLITSPLLITHSVHAQDKAQSALEKLRGDDIKKITESKALKDKNVQFVEGDLETEVLPRVLRIIFSLSSLLIMIIFVYAGIRLVFAQGDEEELGNAKNMLVYSIVGAVIIMISFGLVTGVVSFLTNINS